MKVLKMLYCKFLIDTHHLFWRQNIKTIPLESLCPYCPEHDWRLVTSPDVSAPGGNHQWHHVTTSQGQWVPLVTLIPAPGSPGRRRPAEESIFVSHFSKMMPIKKTLVSLSLTPSGPMAAADTLQDSGVCHAGRQTPWTQLIAKLSLVTPIAWGVTLTRRYCF